MLQQPANEHPYHLGREITFKSCSTLVALDECFSFASCGSLTLESITVIDDLPYTRKKDRTTPEYRKTIRGHGANIIHAKGPSVVLCMSQEKEDTPSPTALLKSLGIGMTFRESIICLGSDHYTKRINAFHPSYALHYRPDESAFRQLLLLEVSRACGELRGDWKEEEWMQDLRRHCRGKAQQKELGVGYVMYQCLTEYQIANISHSWQLMLSLEAISTGWYQHLYTLIANPDIASLWLPFPPPLTTFHTVFTVSPLSTFSTTSKSPSPRSALSNPRPVAGDLDLPNGVLCPVSRNRMGLRGSATDCS
jgi:hypothetical protein